MESCKQNENIKRVTHHLSFKFFSFAFLFFNTLFSHSDPELTTQSIKSPGSYIIHGGPIIPMSNPNRASYHEAIAINKNKIIFVGSINEAIKRNPNAIEINLKGKTLLPGFIEPHVHPSLAAIILPNKIIAPFEWSLPNGLSQAAQSHSEYMKILSTTVSNHSSLEKVLFSWGYHQLWHGQISRDLLNKVSSNIPLVIIHRSFHEAYLNDKAIQLFNIKKSNFTNHPQVNWEKGHFFEAGFASIIPMLSKHLLEPKRYLRGLAMMSEIIQRNGITTIAEPGFPNINFENELALLKYEMEKKPPYSVYLIPNAARLESAKKSRRETLAFINSLTKYDTRNIKFLNKQIKIFADGAIYSQAMQVSGGYNNSSEGKWMTPPAYLSDLFRFYWREKFKLHIHANGDKAISHLLELVDESNKAYPRDDHNTTLHHMGYFTDSLAERIKNLGAEASINPYYLWALSDKYTESGLGAQRAQNLVTANSLARRDINFSFHSDFAMAPLSPLTLASTAINRISHRSTKVSQHQRLNSYDALKAITISAAKTLELQDELGSIEVGKMANFVVLNKNPLMVIQSGISSIKVEGTVYQGIYYSNN